MSLPGAVFAVAVVAATAGARLASGQTIVNADRAEITQKIVVGGTTFGDVLRIVGSPTITSGNGTINPAVIDADGDVLEDSFTTVSAAGAYTWSVGGTFSNGLSVGGSLTGTSGTLDIGNVTRFQLTQPQLRFYESDQAANLRYWLLRAENTQIAMEAWDDSISTLSTLWRGYRRASADTYGAAGSADTFEIGANVRNLWPASNSFSKLGDYNRRWLSLDVDALRAQVFVVNETQAFTNGALLVSRGSSLSRDLSNSATVIHVNHKGFRYFDFVVMRGLSATSGTPQAEWMKLTTGSYDCTEGDTDEVAGTVGANPPLHANCGGVDNNDYAYAVARDQAGSGPFAWSKGSAVPSTDRYLDIYSFNAATIPFGGAVLGDKAVVYWDYNRGTTTIPNAARSGGGDAVSLAGGTGGGGGFPGAETSSGANGAWHLAGTNAVIHSTNVPDLNVSQANVNQDAAFACHGTLEMVLFLTPLANQTGAASVDLVSKWNTVGLNSATFILRSHGASAGGGLAGSIQLLGFQNGTTTLLAPTISPATNNWYHIVWTWGNHNGGNVYVNGVKQGTSIAPTTFCSVNNDDPIRVAGWGGAGAGNATHVSELALYAYDMSADQVAAHWRALQTDVSGLYTGPTIAGFERQSDTNWYGVSPRWACGNLAGYYDYRRQTYGCSFGDYTGDWTAIDDKGWRVMHQNTVKMSASGGNLFLTGNLTIGTGGSIIGGNYSLNETGLSVPVTTTDVVSTPFAHRWTGGSAGGDLYMQAYDYTGSARGLVLKNHVAASKQGSIFMESKTPTGFTRASMTILASDVSQSASVATVAGNTTIAHEYLLSTADGSLHATPDQNVDLGKPTHRWDEFYFWPTTTTTSYPVLVLNTSNGQVLRKTNGYSGSCTTGTYENGVLVSCP